MRPSDPKLNQLLGEMWGENAIHSQFAMVACAKEEVLGVKRTLVGGLILAEMVKTDGWERWMGTVILIPKSIDVQSKEQGANLSHMVHTLGVESSHDEPYWVPRWRERG